MLADVAPAHHRYPPRLDALTPLRFVAAALIAAGHGADRVGFSLGGAAPYAIGTAVSFFFVLSGFVLAYNYPSLDGDGDVRRFYVMRVARIWPLHLAGLVAILLVVPQAGWVLPGIDATLAAPLVATLTQSWFTLVAGYAGAYNPPAWTLSVDVFFYLAFPLLLLAMRSAPSRTFVAALVLSVACPLVATWLGPTNRGDPVTGWNWYLLDRTFPLARLAEFALGMLAARAFDALRARAPRSRVGASAIELVALGTAAVAMAAIHRMPYAAPWLGPGVADWLTHVGVAPFFALTIVAMALGGGAFSALMSTRPAIHLGNLSYAIYVLHIPVLVLDPWPRLAQDYGPWPAAAACALALLVVAHVAHIAIELPARRAIVRAYERRDAAAAARAAGLPTS